jgi:hypothetical protein
MRKSVLQSIILAEHVYEDRATGKKIIAGIFHRLTRIKPPGKPMPKPATAPIQAAPSAPQAPAPSPRSGTPDIAQQERVIQIPMSGLTAGSPFLYLSLTELYGPSTFLLRFVSLADGAVLFHSELKANAPNPLETVEAVVALPPLSPPNSGVYALELLQNNELLGSLRIVVDDAPSI